MKGSQERAGQGEGCSVPRYESFEPNRLRIDSRTWVVSALLVVASVKEDDDDIELEAVGKTFD